MQLGRRSAGLAGFVGSALTVGLLAACQHDVTSVFPPGLEPLEANPIPAQEGGAPTETLRVDVDDTDYIHIYGRGFVLASMADVWTAAQDPNADVAMCTTDQQMITPNNDPAYEFSFLVHYVVNDFVTVEWDDQWRFGEIAASDGDGTDGSDAMPAFDMIKHQKIDGSSFIKLSEGTVELLPTDDPDVTELEFVEHLNAVGGSDGDVQKGVQHNYDSIVAVTHGGDVPPCP